VLILILVLSKSSSLIGGQKGILMAVKIDKEKCTGCTACIDVCPVNAIKIEGGKAVVSEDCILCGACISQCSVGAITL